MKLRSLCTSNWFAKNSNFLPNIKMQFWNLYFTEFIKSKSLKSFRLFFSPFSWFAHLWNAAVLQDCRQYAELLLQDGETLQSTRRRMLRSSEPQKSVQLKSKLWFKFL